MYVCSTLEYSTFSPLLSYTYLAIIPILQGIQRCFTLPPVLSRRQGKILSRSIRTEGLTLRPPLALTPPAHPVSILCQTCGLIVSKHPGACQGHVWCRDSTYNDPSLFALWLWLWMCHMCCMCWKQASGSPDRKGCLPRVSRVHIQPQRNHFPRHASNIYIIFPAPSRK